MDERFADNLPWPYHLIPVLTGLIGLVMGSYLTTYGPLSFPICLIIGGFGGLILLGNISDKNDDKKWGNDESYAGMYPGEKMNHSKNSVDPISSEDRDDAIEHRSLGPVWNFSAT